MKKLYIVLVTGIILGSVLLSWSIVLLVIKNQESSVYASTCSQKLVIDTDAGVDDATAILLVLSAWAHHDSNFEVIAITCTYGNTAEANVRRNVLKTITTANDSQIPVYGGAQKPLTSNFVSYTHFGTDGLGDFVMNEKVTAEVDESYHAATVLVNLARQYPKQLDVLALGPLTNIALAISLDVNFVRNVKKFYIMGGSVEGLGNLWPGVEFNFGADPVSNFIVLNSTMRPSLLLPWETVVQSTISKKWRTEVLGQVDSKIMRFLNKAEKKSLNVSSSWGSADTLTAAVMMWPELIKKSIVVNASPVMDGEARGTILVDYRDKTGKPKNVQLVQKLNTNAYMDKLMYHFS